MTKIPLIIRNDDPTLYAKLVRNPYLVLFPEEIVQNQNLARVRVTRCFHRPDIGKDSRIVFQQGQKSAASNHVIIFAQRNQLLIIIKNLAMRQLVFNIDSLLIGRSHGVP